MRWWTARAGAVFALVALAPAPAAAVDVPGPAQAVTVPDAGAPVAREAIAVVEAFDCAGGQVRLRLDNTRSAVAARFAYGAAFVRPLRAPYRGTDHRADVVVPPGTSRSVVLPLRDDARTAVTVHLPDGHVAQWRTTCGNAPGVIFGPSDCAARRLSVLLDNRTAAGPTRFRWVLEDPAGLVATEVVEVDGGAVSIIEVPLVADAWVVVKVAVDGRGAVASRDRQACGWVVLDPRATFGVVDCSDVSVPVILDNSRSSTRLLFHLPGADVVLGPGETRSMRLHAPIREVVAVTVDDVLPRGRSVVRAVTSTAHCAMASAAGLGGGPGAVVRAGRAAAVGAGAGDDPASGWVVPSVAGGVALLALAALGTRLSARGTRRRSGAR